MSCVYILPLKNKTAFKVGKSDNPMSRITKLLGFYDIDVNLITIIDCRTTSSSFIIETMFHNIFDEYQMIFEYEGGTEFFSYSVYESAIELSKLICKTKKYSIIPFIKDVTIKPISPTELITNRYANLVKNKRLELNISQLDLAKASSVSKRTVERFENDGQATFENVVKIFSVLGIQDNFINHFPLNSNRKRVKKRKIYVGTSDHEPDAPVEIETEDEL